MLDFKKNPTKRTSYSLSPGTYEITDINTTLRHIPPDNVKINLTVDDKRLKSILKINQTLIFTKSSFFYKKVGFTQSHQGPVNDIEGFYQILPGNYKSEKPINLTGVDKVHLEFDRIQGSIVNDTREPILNSFALSSPPGYKIYNQE